MALTHTDAHGGLGFLTLHLSGPLSLFFFVCLYLLAPIMRSWENEAHIYLLKPKNLRRADIWVGTVGWGQSQVQIFAEFISCTLSSCSNMLHPQPECLTELLYLICWVNLTSLRCHDITRMPHITRAVYLVRISVASLSIKSLSAWTSVLSIYLTQD